MAWTLAQQVACFGCTEQELREGVERSIPLSGAPMIAMSILSDSQELLERGLSNEARQSINRAKWVISTYVMERRNG